MKDIEDYINELIKDMMKNYTIIPHMEILNEIASELSGCGKKEQFLTQLTTRCNILDTYGKSAHINDPIHFEKLKHTNFDIYSMHIKIEKNIRILYTFCGDTIIMFLCAFNERNGKRKTDYTKYIPLAKKRINECLGGNDHEKDNNA